MTKSYKITFQLSTPLSFISPPTFDGVLSYAWAKEILGDNFTQKLHIPQDEMVDFSKMPIAMNEKGYFMASVMFWDKENMTEFTEKWRKRWHTTHDHLVSKPVKIRVQQGQFKSYDVPYDLKDIRNVWFYFQSDDVEQVRYLVHTWIHFLGKKRAYGNGLIDSFDIEKSDFDFNAQPFRPIPQSLVDVSEIVKTPNFKFLIAYCSWKPPYHAPENMAECITI
jgi:hypothetical protein